MFSKNYFFWLERNMTCLSCVGLPSPVFSMSCLLLSLPCCLKFCFPESPISLQRWHSITAVAIWRILNRQKHTEAICTYTHTQHVHITSTNRCPRTLTLYRYPPVYSLAIVILLLLFNYLLLLFVILICIFFKLHCWLGAR